MVETITGDLLSGPLPEVRSNPCLHDLKLADPGFNRPGRVDVLFGVNFLPTLLRGSTVSSEDKLICAIDTAYGWMVTGWCLSSQDTPRVHLCMTAATLDDPTKDLLISFLEAEGLPANPDTETTTTEDKQRAEDHFASTHSCQPDGSFVV